MRRISLFLSSALVATLLALLSPDAAGAAPKTRAETARLHGQVVDPEIPIDFVGVQWDGDGGTGAVRFRHEGRWTPWQPLPEDGVEVSGRFASALVDGRDADAYQVRTPAGRSGARAVAINTTDGPGRRTAAGADAAVTVTARAGWGADESLMTWAPQFYGPAQKITVHHTSTRNADTDPAATIRAIYRYHAVDRGFGDIGYHYLVDEAGRVYEGRYSGTDGDPAHEAPGSDRVVTAAHVGGYNSANVGIALLGTLTSQGPTASAQRSVEELVAELSIRHGIDPAARSTYTNPVNGVQWTGENVPGHRDWESTECPGGALYALLPSIRANARSLMSPQADMSAPVISKVSVTTRSTTATITWVTDEPATTEVEWRRAGTTTWAVAAGPSGTGHRVDLAGLAPRTRYEYRVRSADAAGNVSVTSTSAFQTKR